MDNANKPPLTVDMYNFKFGNNVHNYLKNQEMSCTFKIIYFFMPIKGS